MELHRLMRNGGRKKSARETLTPHHAKYFAHDLTRRATSGMDRLSMALFDAAVDLNPHQIESALFALQSPLSKGVILADSQLSSIPPSSLGYPTN